MTYLVVFLLSISVSLAFALLYRTRVILVEDALRSGLEQFEAAIKERRAKKEKVEQIYEGMVDLGSLQELVLDLRAAEEALKAERGRITITQAELETVEGRLRELEEIERELEASGIETKEELNILQKKQADLESKNNSLKKKLQEASSQIDQLLSELEDNTQASERIVHLKTELLQTEEKTNTLILMIEEGNEQYFILKRRYDALDIEYAQLYEKFAELEASPPDQ